MSAGAASRRLSHRLAAFGVSGGAGFLVDAGVLALLLAATPLGPFVARAIAIAIAITATWALNRTFVFGASARPLAQEGARYGAVGLTGAALNYAIYTLLLLAAPETWPIAALVIASAVVTLFSWFGYSRFVFGR